MAATNDRPMDVVDGCPLDAARDPTTTHFYELVTSAHATAGRVLDLVREWGEETSPAARLLVLTVRSRCDGLSDRDLVVDLGRYTVDMLRMRLTSPEYADLAGCLELREFPVDERGELEPFPVVYLPAVSVACMEPDERRRALSCARDLLVPGSHLIVASQYVVADAPVRSVLAVAPGLVLTEDIDPVAGRRRLNVRQGSRTISSTLHMVAPASIVRDLRDRGLRPTYQHFEPHPVLRHGRDVLIGARLS